MTATLARQRALGVLRAVRRGVLADRALEEAGAGLSARDRAWVQELVYGTLRLRGRLDHVLAALSRRPLDRLDADVLDILRLGAYQLSEMGGVPAYAAVSESVELAKDAHRSAAGYVNGVLNRLARDAEPVPFPAWDDDALAHLTTWGSHPAWLVRRWLDAFGGDATRRLVDSNNRRPALYLHALGGEVDAVLAALTAADMEASRVAGAPDSVRLDRGTPSEALTSARAIVQDPAASAVARYVAPEPGSRVADVCAAPGGKAIALAGNRAGPARVIAGDVSYRRVARIRESVRRLAPLPVWVVVADARTPPLAWVDAVLIDAPCTGTGTLGRHPDGRWRVRPEDITALVALQAEILEAAASIVRPGGLLTYATCSLEAEENARQVESFLFRHPEFRSEPPGTVDDALLDANGWLHMTPHDHGFDGAFAARLRRR